MHHTLKLIEPVGLGPDEDVIRAAVGVNEQSASECRGHLLDTNEVRARSGDQSVLRNVLRIDSRKAYNCPPIQLQLPPGRNRWRGRDDPSRGTSGDR